VYIYIIEGLAVRDILFAVNVRFNFEGEADTTLIGWEGSDNWKIDFRDVGVLDWA
jgi:hypothetical protein